LKIEQTGNVTSIWFDVKAGWEKWFLLRSDVHHDSIYCNRDYELEHLEAAKKRRAGIFDFGDLFDAMQGRFDKRRSMDELRPEYRRDDYYDYVVKDTADYLKPYAKQFILISPGNHESSVRKHANTDLTDRLVARLNAENKTNILTGGYGGWVRFMFNMSGGSSTGPRASINLKYFHGSGGEAPVTRGAIQTNRQAVYLPDADVVVNGHSHHNYIIPISRERLSNKGVHYFDIQYHIRTPGYKQDYADGSAGWTVERGGVPKPIGAVWMKIYYLNQAMHLQFYPDIQGPSSYQPFEGDAGSYAGGGFAEYAQDGEYP
jgi:UDP-2,3-diacylglucosamine pyrophosphatase LpxH